MNPLHKKNTLAFFHFFSLSLLIFLTFVLFPLGAFSASKGMITLGESFSAEVENISPKDSVDWILSSSGEIITSSQKKHFSYKFTELGNYVLRASVESFDNTKKTTVLEIQVVDKIPSFLPLRSSLETFPPAENGTIVLSGKPGEEASVLFSFSDSTGDIIRYSFESDIFSDFDQNGVIDDDIVNESDLSFSQGGIFSMSYTNNGLPIRARLQVEDDEGNIEESFVNLRFVENQEEQKQRQNKPLKALLTTFSLENENGDILVFEEEDSISVFGGYSEGNIKKYTIDTDLAYDSDGDGNPENDIDNDDTPSFLTGEVFTFPVKKREDPLFFTLSVVDEKGAVSILKKQVIFQNKKINFLSGSTLLEPVLLASRSEIVEGDSVTFQVFSVPEAAKMSWDFDGDGIFEIEDSFESKVEYRFSESGTYPVSVYITELGLDPVVQMKTITVAENFGEQETFPPKALFEPKISGNKVLFSSSESSADTNLLNTDISFAWDFGDGHKFDGPNPIHIYENIGTYTVVLRVEDAVQRESVFSQEITIGSLTDEYFANQHGEDPSLPPQEPEDRPDTVLDISPDDLQEEKDSQDELSIPPQDPSSSFFSSFSSFSFSRLSWWIFLIPLFFLIPLLLALHKKIKEPEKNFSAIFQEIFSFGKKKTSSLEPKNEEIQEKTPLAEDEPSVQEENSSSENLFSGDVLDVDDVQEDAENLEEPTITTSESVAQTPEWMNTYDEQNTISEEVLPNSSELENTLAQEEDSTVPDWLKGVDSPFSDDLPDDSNEVSDVSLETPIETQEDEAENIPDWLTDSQEVPSLDTEENVPEENGVDINKDDSETLSEDSSSGGQESDLESSVELPDDKNPFSDFNHPEWLQDIKEEGKEKNTSEDILFDESENPEDMKDVLKEEVVEEKVLNSVEEEPNMTPEKKKRRRGKKKKELEMNSEIFPPEEEGEEGEERNEENISPYKEENEEIPDWLLSEETEEGDGLKEDLAEKEVLNNSTEEELTIVPQQETEKMGEDFSKDSLSASKKAQDISSSENTPEVNILAQDAKIPLEEDSSKIPEWLQK